MRSLSLPNRSARLLVAVPAVLAALALSTAACGEEDGGTTAPVSPSQSAQTTTGPTASTTSDAEAALSSAVDELLLACRTRDRDRLRDLTSDGVRDRIRDRDRLFSTVDQITVIDREIAINGDTATVTVTLEVTIDGETTQVERVWTYVLVDGEWLLSEVPDCLFS